MIFQKIRTYRTFILEILAVFVGITASFWVENFREDISNEKVKKDIIKSIYADLEQDEYEFTIVRDNFLKEKKQFYSQFIGKDRQRISDSLFIELISMMQSKTIIEVHRLGYQKLMNSRLDRVVPIEIQDALAERYDADIPTQIDIWSNQQAIETTNLVNSYLLDSGIYLYTDHEIDITTHSWYSSNPFISQNQVDNIRKAFETEAFQATMNLKSSLVNMQYAILDSHLEDRIPALKKLIREYYLESYGEDLSDWVGGLPSTI
jgi:hypothetical protein